MKQIKLVIPLLIIILLMAQASGRLFSYDFGVSENDSIIKNYITKNIELSLVAEYLSRVNHANSSFRHKNLQEELDLNVPLLDSGCTFLVELQKADCFFPDSNYIVYRYIFNGYTNCDYDTIENGDKYFLWPLFLKSWYRGILENTYRIGLVAWNNNKKHIKFICGTLFQDKIQHYFFKDTVLETYFYEYIWIKFYNLRPYNINIDMNKLTATFNSTYVDDILYKVKIIKYKPESPKDSNKWYYRVEYEEIRL